MAASNASVAYSVLLADEDDGTASILGACLEGSHVSVLRARDGPTALAMAAAQPVDVVIADALLPGMPGAELTRSLKNTPLTASVPVILLAGGVASAADEADLQRGSRADAVMRKPAAGREVLARADALVMLRTGKVRHGAMALGMPTQRPAHGASPAVPPLSGESGILGVAPVLMHALDQRLTALLEISDPVATRSLALHDGLVVGAQGATLNDSLSAFMVQQGMLNEAMAHATSVAMGTVGGRFGENAARVAGLSPSRVAAAMDLHQEALAQWIIGAPGGTFALRPWTETPYLQAQVRLDPVRLVMRAALALPSEDLAASLMTSLKTRALHAGEGVGERVATLQTLVEGTRIGEVTRGNPTLEHAVAHARVLGTDGVRQVLGLLLTGGIRVGPPPAAGSGRRAGLVLGPPRPWTDAGTPPAHAFVREMVATEVLRTTGRSAPGVLSVDWNATPAEVHQAVVALRARFGPPALDDAPLGGPARAALELLRLRREEAARVMLDPGVRERHRAAVDGGAR